MSTNQIVSKDHIELHKKPLVFLFDFEKEVVEELKKLQINISEGSFGSKIRVDNKKNEHKFLKLLYQFPENLHEFDIVMLDLTKDKFISYELSEHQLLNTSGNTAHALLSEYVSLPSSAQFVTRDICC